MKFNCRRRLLLLGATLFAAVSTFGQPAKEINVRNFNQPKLQWWQEARFGMFIHWGPVSLIGKEISWSREQYGKGRYDSLYLKFNPTQFNPTEWVRSAQQAGMKYMVFTAKHHDGFCMWDTKTTDYKITNSPLGRDVCKELAEAAHKVNMPVCWYFSPADWKDKDCRNPASNAVFEKRVLEQLTELLTNYGKISLLWIDYEGGPCPLKPQLIYELANKLQPGIVLNNRLDVLHTDESHSYVGPNGDYATPEGFVAGYGAVPWETCTNLGHQWAWRFNDTPRPINEAAALLLKCAGGNGNLLLNVGPDSSGVFPASFTARLNEFGNWLQPIATSIYGTKGGPYAPTPAVVSTYKGQTIYLHIMKAVGDTITLPPLNAKILSAKIIQGTSLAFSQTKKSLKIVLPAKVQMPVATTLELTIDSPVEKLGIVRPFSTTGSLAYNKKITSSSSVGQFLHDATAANDDNPATFWVPGRRDNIDIQKYYGTNTHYSRNKEDIKAIFDTTGWLEVDLGRKQLVSKVKLSERVILFSKINRFELQYKKGNKWISWFSDTVMGEWEKELPPVNARFFRLVVLDRAYMSGIKEFQLFAPSN